MLHPVVADMRFFYLHAAVLLPQRWLVLANWQLPVFVLVMIAITTIVILMLYRPVFGLCEAVCMTECTIVHWSLQVSDCLENAYVPRSAAAAVQTSNHHCCCTASYLTDGVVVH